MKEREKKVGGREVLRNRERERVTKRE